MVRTSRAVAYTMLALKFSEVIDLSINNALGIVLFLSLGALLIALLTLFLIIKIGISFGDIPRYIIWVFILEVYLFVILLCAYFTGIRIYQSESIELFIYVGLVANTLMLIFTEAFKECIW